MILFHLLVAFSEVLPHSWPSFTALVPVESHPALRYTTPSDSGRHPISSSLLLTSCQACARDPGFPSFANTSFPPCPLLSIIDFRYFWYLGKGGRGRASSALFQSIAIEWEGEACSGRVLGNWLIHPPIKPRGPCGGAVYQGQTALVIFRKSFPSCVVNFMQQEIF